MFCNPFTYIKFDNTFVPISSLIKCMYNFSLLSETRNLANHWEHWMMTSLENLPERLVEQKTQVARRFALALKRQVSFLHLAQVCVTRVPSIDWLIDP